MTCRKWTLAWVVVLFAATIAKAAPYKSEPGPNAVAEWLGDWVDEDRDRELPIKIYYPRDLPGPLPVVIVSHGLGGTREGLEYVGRHWASHGYVSAHPQHVGSDDSVWRGKDDVMDAMRRAITIRASIDRPADISFVLDTLEDLPESHPLYDRIDMERVGMAGHSYGAYTTMAIAGQNAVTPRGRTYSFRDDRIKAAIAMGAPAPDRPEQYEMVFAGIRIPLFHMTGTLDDSLISDTRAEERRIPFDNIEGVDQCLLIFDGGDHMAFSGRRFRGDDVNDARFHDLIKQSSTAFLDAYALGDEKALEWLRTGFEEELGEMGVFEQKTGDCGNVP